MAMHPSYRARPAAVKAAAVTGAAVAAAARTRPRTMALFWTCLVLPSAAADLVALVAPHEVPFSIASPRAACPSVRNGTDQKGGTLLAGRKPKFLNTTDSNECCTLCINLHDCTTWIREPQTGHCWLLAGGTPIPSTDRTAGFLARPPPPPAPPPPSPLPPPLPSTPPNIFVEAFGNDSIRIRITYALEPVTNIPSGVLPRARRDARVSAAWGSVHTDPVLNGNIEAVVHGSGVTVTRRSDNVVLFATTDLHIETTQVPHFYGWNLTVTSSADEKVWGLGERSQGTLNNKGSNIDFRTNQHNTMITIPFAVSSKRYGVLFNSAAWGGIDLLRDNCTVFSAIMSKQLDFLVMTHPATAAATPFPPILTAYYAAIGLPPVLPTWALGFWASKQRYASQTELVNVVHQYRAHNISVDVLVIDWKHYQCVGDWNFTLDPAVCWPDPAAMVSALNAFGVKQVFVSLHPWSEPGSTTHSAMVTRGLCARNASGEAVPWGGWRLPTCAAPAPGPGSFSSNCLYDASNPRSRQFLWDELQSSYFDRGITNFWTDGTEPAGAPAGGLPFDIVFYSDETNQPEWPAASAFMAWPVWHSKTIAQGTASAGSPDSWSLARSAWLGSHLHNTIVWSGDIQSSWETLASQVKIGLNMQLVYPYWNSDTAGFGGGDWQTMGELIVRWFQFSIFTGVVRMHGDRSPHEPQLIPLEQQCDPTHAAGGPIEPWVYGPSNIPTLGGVQAALEVRKTLLPYLTQQIELLSTRGQPFMRPLWYDFPDDATVQEVQDQFMFGPDYMVAPVLTQGATSRAVIFPGKTGADLVYTHYFTGKVYYPGQHDVSLGSLSTFPLFKVGRSG